MRPAVVCALALLAVAVAGATTSVGLAADPLSCPVSAAGRPAPAVRPHYALTVKLGRDRFTVSGTERVDFAAAKPVDRVVLRLWPNSLAQTGARIAVSGVRTPGRASKATLPDRTTLLVKLAKPARRVRVDLAWRLHLPPGNGGRLVNSYGDLRLGSFFPILAWDGHAWALDPPSPLKAETGTSPAADFDVTVSAPRGVRVLATGTQVAPGRWHARAVRDFAVAAGRFDVATVTAHAGRPVKITTAVQRGAAANASAFAAHVRDSLEELARRYGPYPWPEYQVVVYRDLGGEGIEYPTLVFQGDASLARASTHEAAHQWFYSLVGNNQARDPWLDESLATWAQARIDGSMPFFLSAQVPPAAQGRLTAPMSYWSANPSDYFEGVYVQGVQALNSLGDARLVDCALRLYAARNAYRVATVNDLVNALAALFPPEALRRLEAYG